MVIVIEIPALKKITRKQSAVLLANTRPTYYRIIVSSHLPSGRQCLPAEETAVTCLRIRSLGQTALVVAKCVKFVKVCKSLSRDCLELVLQSNSLNF